MLQIQGGKKKRIIIVKMEDNLSKRRTWRMICQKGGRPPDRRTLVHYGGEKTGEEGGEATDFEFEIENLNLR